MKSTIKNLLQLTKSIATIGGTGRGSPLVQQTETFEELNMKLLKRKAKMTEETGAEVIENTGTPADVQGEAPVVEAKPRAPKTTILPKSPDAVLRVNSERVAKYKGQRAERATILADGMTFGAYMEAGGDKGFLSFFIKDGAVSVE